MEPFNPGEDSDTPLLDFVARGKHAPGSESPSRSGRTPKRYRVLMIEDDGDDAALVQQLLGEMAVSFDMERVDRLSAGLARLARVGIDVVLLDLMLPDGKGLDNVVRIRSIAAAVPIVVLTGLEDRALGIQAIRVGAQDFLIKREFDSNVLGRSLRYAIERNRRRRAEAKVDANRVKLEMAREIQQALLPYQDPEVAGFDISGSTLAAETVGGDYFDYIRLADGSLGVVVGDATGHGFGPALMITQIQAFLRALSLTHGEVGRILTFANRALADSSDRCSRFVTAIFARLDPVACTLTYSSAGHPEAYVLGAGGEVKACLRSTNLPLGLVPEETYAESAPLRLEPGDLVLMVSDGILEAKNLSRTLLGIEPVLEVVRSASHLPAREIIAKLLQAVQDFGSNLPLADDMTAVVVKQVQR